VFTASLLDVQHLKGLVSRASAKKFPGGQQKTRPKNSKKGQKIVKKTKK